jgi:hypothetical protein
MLSFWAIVFSYTRFGNTLAHSWQVSRMNMEGIMASQSGFTLRLTETTSNMVREWRKSIYELLLNRNRQGPS